MKSLITSTTIGEFSNELHRRFCWMVPYATGEHNSLGFRDHELIINADICYYGCSFTYGESVDISERWTARLDSKTNMPSNNFGMIGASIDDILAIFVATTNFVRMKKALFLLPSPSRQTMLFSHDKFKKISPEYDTTLQEDPEGRYAANAWFRLPHEYHLDRANTAINLISYIANLNNIVPYFSSWDIETYKLLTHNVTRQRCHSDSNAADGRHPSASSHLKFSQQFFEIL